MSREKDPPPLASRPSPFGRPEAGLDPSLSPSSTAPASPIPTALNTRPDGARRGDRRRRAPRSAPRSPSRSAAALGPGSWPSAERRRRSGLRSRGCAARPTWPTGPPPRARRSRGRPRAAGHTRYGRVSSRLSGSPAVCSRRSSCVPDTREAAGSLVTRRGAATSPSSPPDRGAALTLGLSGGPDSGVRKFRTHTHRAGTH